MNQKPGRRWAGHRNMTKAELRRQYLARQQALHPDQVAAQSEQIADQFFQVFDVAAYRVLHCFLPIVKSNEINTWQLIKRFTQDFPTIEIAVPRTDPATLRMTSYRLTPDMPLVKTRWGVPEPTAGEVVAANRMDGVLLPLLAYDARGHRVGYGKGFYDRFLTECRPDVARIGLSYFAPVDGIDDVHAFDVPLTHCVTPEKVWNFARPITDAHLRS